MTNNESETRSLLSAPSIIDDGEELNHYEEILLTTNTENTNLLEQVQMPEESTSIDIEFEESPNQHNDNNAEIPISAGTTGAGAATGGQVISFLSFIRRNGMPNLSTTNHQVDWRRNLNNWFSFSIMPNRASTHNTENNNNNNDELIDWVRASILQVNSENSPNEFQRQQSHDETNAIDNDIDMSTTNTTTAPTTTTDENHRNNSENFYSQQQNEQQEVERQRQQEQEATLDNALQLLVKILRHIIFYLPFLCIFLTKVIYDHFMGIFDILILQYFFLLMNNSLCNQINKLSQKSYKILIRDLVLITFIICYNMSKGDPERFGLLISPPAQLQQEQQPQSEHYNYNANMHTITSGIRLPNPSPSFSLLLYYVIINDLVIKLLTIVTKISLTMLPTNLIHHKSKTRIYALVEYLSQFYRATCPIREWTAYLCGSYVGLDVIYGIIFTCLYLTAKGFEFVKRGKSLKNAIITVMDTERRPTERELSEADVICSICHDAFTLPIVIKCGHIFCEDCVNTWFKREQTCPMCRAKVRADITYQDGSTSSFYQIF